MALTNATLNGNTSDNSGALAIGAGTATLVNVTVAGNSGGSGVGGLLRGGGTLSLRNTIVANNTGAATNCVGSITNTSDNLDSGSTCGFGTANGSLSNSNPLLAALASNGGSTQTMALGAGSPAINAGTATGAPTTDQRGASRSGATDIGAYEYGGTVPGAYSVSGTVFEDVNYGGGAGRSLASSGGVGVNGATVELYDSSGVFVSSTTTAGGGAYSFTGLAAGTHHVRVVNSTVPSQRSGTGSALRGVMTYRTTASSGSAVAVSDFVGGTNPAVADAGAGASGATFNTTTGVYSAVVSGTAQSVAPVTVGSASITGIDFGFNFDTIVNTNDSGQGSLRQAITNANTLSGDASLAQSGRTAGIENLVFMISNGTTGSGGSLALTGGLRSTNNQFSGGIATIAPASALPEVTGMVLDAQAQPGWSAAPIIEINGAGAGAGISGLTARGSTTLRGFIVNRFTSNGVNFYDAGNNVLQGSYIGLNSAGTAASANGGHGVNTYNSPNNSFGGTGSSAGNVISGNGGIGINLSGTGGGVVIQGNTIGLNAAGTARVANGSIGVLVGSGSVTLGGTNTAARNVIAGNTYENVQLGSAASGSTFQGNYIGTTGGGATGITSGGHGLWLNGASNVQVGGTAAGAGNVFAGNSGRGVTLSGNVSGNAVLGNSIFGNGSIGIDLANDGITANDGALTAGQPNRLMDHPVFTTASLAGTTLTVAGHVGSAAGQATFASARVEVFISDATNTNGQGRTYLGYFTSDASGNFSGSIANVAGVTAGSSRLTGTATDASNNTSEFGPNALVTGLTLSGTVFEDVNYGGGAGRSLAGSSGVGLAGATVELYDASGVFVSSTTTAAGGAYSFTGLASATHHVRVVNSTVASQRSGTTGTLRGVMTYRTIATSGSAMAVTDFVGGTNPALVDPGAGSSGASFNTVTGVYSAVLSGTAQSYAAVTVGSANITGIDFGFNFGAIVNTNDSGQGSLRQAITNANTLTGDSSLAQSGRTAGIENLVFMISNGTAAAGMRSTNNYFATSAGSYNVATIAPTSALPAIAEALVIDAQTQPGWTLNPIVEINGASAGSNAGLRSSVAGNAVRGLVINRWTGDGIYLGSSGNTVSGNWIGLNAAGTAASANTVWGIEVNASSNTIGGSTAAARNVISGNGDLGIYIRSGSSNVIQGNYVGTNAAGTAAVANASHGIMVHSSTSSNTIGGSSAGQGNLIAGNGGAGVRLRSGSGANIIRGNIIGLNAAANAAVPNALGIQIDAAGNNNRIGGAAAGDGNIIASNTGSGIAISGTPASTGNAILGNSIHANGAIGIDLGTAAGGSAGDGITVNTGAKTSGEPNLLMNYPVLTGASLSGTTLTVTGYVGSAAGQAAFASSRVEVFVSDNTSANGSGQTYLGFVTADANGNFSGTVTVPGSVTLVAGSTRLTGTATDTANNTSEFGPNFTYGLGISGTVFEDVNYGGGAGRSLAASGGVGMAGATVELYRASGAYVSSTTTASDGSYAFANLAAEGHVVRVLTSSLRSTRSGSIAGLWPVQTWRFESSWQTPAAVTNEVGGAQPGVADSGAALTLAWSNCASENGNCAFTGTRVVRYGADTRWTARVATGGVVCSNAVFGDPAQGTGKTCEVLTPHLHSASSVHLAGAGATAVDFGFSFSTVVNTNDSGQGSLRQALTNANTLGGDASLAQSGRTAAIENLVFMIGNGSAAAGLRSANNFFTTSAGSYNVATISPASALPTVTAPLVMDAQTQPGWTLAPLIELNGSSAGAGVNGLTVAAAGSVIRGWVINRFQNDGFRGSAVGSLVIQGNYFGTTAGGNAAAPNVQRGMYLQGGGSNQVVGGSLASQRNVISGNSGRGITIAGGSGHRVQGNRVGVGADGSTSVPNGGFGVLMQSGATNSQVGGTAAGEGNVIAGNARAVQVDSGVSGIAVLGNSIYGNTLGINLGVPGPNLNDGAKSAGQANLLMDSPVITAARARGPQLTVAGYIGTAAGQTLFGGSRVELFISDSGSTHGSGQTYLGFVTADANGNFNGTITLPFNALRAGTVLTGTATDTASNTSEFGANFGGLVVDWLINHNGDGVDANPGDGLCETATAGQCTLRAAIMESNARAGDDFAAFELPSCPGAGCVITPASALPTITGALTIDAQTQPGWTLAPIVDLRGTSAGSNHGLNIAAAGSTVRGLVIGGFGQGGDYAGVYLNANNATLEGNYIGLAADGSTALPNGSSGSASGGVYVAGGTGIVIGGTTAAQRNVLSGNGGAGVWMSGGSATLIGNHIGTDATGALAVGNRRWGVQIAGGTHQIGGAAAGQGNVISGNTYTNTGGIVVGSAGNTIQGNTIGMNAARSAALPNGNGGSTYASGIDVRSAATGTTIGGTNPGEGNLIAGNQGHGVRAMSQTTRILGNSISNNLWLGIDLNADGVTANNGTQSGSVPNNGMDHPVITSAGYDPATRALTVTGHVGTGTGQAVFAGSRIELFTSDSDASGFGEGTLFVGTLTADASGRFSGSVTVPVAVSFAVGTPLTGTATDTSNNSSEFGPNLVTTTMSALAPSRFNAFETGTLSGALTGVIQTRVAGTAGSIAVIAIDQSGSALQTGFAGTVALEWVNATDNTGALDAGNCRASWVAGGSAGSATFVSGDQGRHHSTVTPTTVGREWRLRMSYTGPGGTVTACSTDAFAVRPASLAITGVSDADDSTAGTTRLLDNLSASGGRVHRAGRPFSLRAAARDAASALATGYTGTPTLAVTGCVLPAGCAAGTLSVPSLVASAGLVAADTLSYSEVGAINLQLTDDSFADIDAADTLLAQRRIQSAVVGVGRFVPDRYLLAVAGTPQFATQQGSCAAAGQGFSFVGQNFGWASAPAFTVTAQNAAGATTALWGGALQKLNPTVHVARSLAAANAQGLTPAVSWGSMTVSDAGNGVASVALSGDQFLFPRNASAPVASFNPVITLGLAVSDSSELAVTGNSAVASASALVIGSGTGIGFNQGSAFHYGRLKLQNAFGDVRRGVRANVELQKFTDRGWLRLSEDNSCITVPQSAIAFSAGSGAFATDLCTAPASAAIALRQGRGMLVLPRTAGNIQGALMATLNIGSTLEGNACTAGVPATPTSAAWPHLLGARGTGLTQDQNPAARLVWGRQHRDYMVMRELF